MRPPTYRSLLVDAVAIMRKLADTSDPKDRQLIEGWMTLALRLLYPQREK